MTIRAAARTDVGRVRERNEDAYLLLPERRLFAVADGMGGHAAGEVASALAIETFALYGNAFDHDEGILGVFCTAFDAAHNALLGMARARRELTGMGTTLTAAYVQEGLVTIGHVGDSRAYLARGGACRRLTTDHARGNVLSNCLGARAESHKKTDVFSFSVEEGNVLLLVTDGISCYASEPTIAAIVSRQKNAEAIAEALVRHAVDCGGRDNATAVVLLL